MRLPESCKKLTATSIAHNNASGYEAQLVVAHILGAAVDLKLSIVFEQMTERIFIPLMLQHIVFKQNNQQHANAAPVVATMNSKLVAVGWALLFLAQLQTASAVSPLNVFTACSTPDGVLGHCRGSRLQAAVAADQAPGAAAALELPIDMRLPCADANRTCAEVRRCVQQGL